MGLNIGKAAYDAAQELKGNLHWVAVCDGVLEQSRKYMNAALDCGPETREFAAGYAAALRDVWLAFENATTAVPMNRIEKPAPVKKG